MKCPCGREYTLSEYCALKPLDTMHHSTVEYRECSCGLPVARGARAMLVTLEDIKKAYEEAMEETKK